MFLLRSSVAWMAFCLIASPVGAASAKRNIGILGSKPRWSVLEKYQETITRADFLRLLNGVYCTHGRPERLITVSEEGARILMSRDPDKYFALRFSPNDKTKRPVPHLWRSAASRASVAPDKALDGARIALDPGHLGGDWAKM